MVMTASDVFAREFVSRRANDLRVYQEAFQLSLEVHRICAAIPAQDQLTLADPMRRASKGICLALAEAFQRNTSAGEFRRYVMIGICCCAEMQVWTEYALALGHAGKDMAMEWSQKYEQLSEALNKLRLS